MNFASIILRHDTNVLKNLWAEGFMEEDARMVCGDDGLELLKNSKKFVEDYLIYITLKDNLSDSKRQEMLDLFKSAVSQPEIMRHLHRIIKTLNAKSTAAAIDELESLSREINKENEEAAQANQEKEARIEMANIQHDKETQQSDQSFRASEKSKDREIKLLKLELDASKLKIEQLQEQRNGGHDRG